MTATSTTHPILQSWNNFARSFSLRQSWVTMLLDDPNAAYDTNGEFEVYYDGFYVGDKPAEATTAAP